MTFNTSTSFAITSEAARLLALHEAGQECAEFDRVELIDGLWELEFKADELSYSCYVDAETGFVPGITFSPVPVETYPAYALAEGARAA